MSRRIVNTGLVVLMGVIAYLLIVKHNDMFAGRDEAMWQASDSTNAADAMRTYGSATRRGEGVERRARTADRPLDEGIDEPTYELSPFDPNTADTTALLRLGFPRWMVRGILRYRAAGGRFRCVDDLKSIYGMTPEIYERIAPYVTIDQRFVPYDREQLARERREARSDTAHSDTFAHRPKLLMGQTIELNTATDSMLCLVPGIGEHRARAILHRREQLGGYVSVEQLGEIADIPDSSCQYFVVDARAVQRININTATLSAMRRHPYIGQRRAAAIYNYRRMYGTIHSLDDVRLHPDLHPDSLQRMMPYITLGEN